MTKSRQPSLKADKSSALPTTSTGAKVSPASSGECSRSPGSDRRSTYVTLALTGTARGWWSAPISMPSPLSHAAIRLRVFVNDPSTTTTYPSDTHDVQRAHHQAGVQLVSGTPRRAAQSRSGASRSAVVLAATWRTKGRDSLSPIVLSAHGRTDGRS